MFRQGSWVLVGLRGGVRLRDLSGFRSIVAVLSALESQPEGATALELCEASGLSRGAVDLSLGILLESEMVSKNQRRFGRPCRYAVNGKGLRAARHIRSLELLFSPSRLPRSSPSAQAPSADGGTEGSPD